MLLLPFFAATPPPSLMEAFEELDAVQKAEAHKGGAGR